MIDVRCFTTLDDHSREVWPTKMVCRPEIGDRVASISGKRLKVVSLTHDQTMVGVAVIPVLFVELNR